MIAYTMSHLLSSLLLIACLACFVSAHEEKDWCAKFGTLYCPNAYYKNACSHTCKEFTPDSIINGFWSPWEAWSVCNTPCGIGQRTRERDCDNPSPEHGGTECLTSSEDDDDRKMEETQSEDCFIKYCPINGGWSQWGDSWSDCSVTCNAGLITKERTCTNPPPQYEGETCAGNARKDLSCAMQPCPIDGGYSDWMAWSECTLTCGEHGLKFRRRVCNNPSPLFGGRDCGGTETESESCNVKICPINGGYSEWTSYSTCTASCGRGFQHRSRCCIQPVPAQGGVNCEALGKPLQLRTCRLMLCPMDGGWTDWVAWATCTASCGFEGKRYRHRDCLSPSPRYNGTACPAEDGVGEEPCNRQNCIVDGGWTEWASWTRCSQSCGTGLKYQLRCCMNPAPAHGGANCPNDMYPVRSESCNLSTCP